MTGNHEFDRLVREGARRMSPAGPCVSEERLAAFYGEALSEAEADAVREHLATCRRCVEVARDARGFVASMTAERPPASMIMRRRILLAAAAALAGIAVIVSAGRIARRGADNISRWPVAPAPFATEDDLVWRGANPTPAGSLDAAAARYRAGDYRGATVDLASYVAAHPADARGRFYLGVARLLSGDPSRAADDLAAARALTRAPDATDWYLALACLHAGALDRARVSLDRVASDEGEHREQAKEILRQLDERRRP